MLAIERMHEIEQQQQRLVHHYWVDQWMKIEEMRLNFIRLSQQNLKAYTYKGTADAVANGE